MKRYYLFLGGANANNQESFRGYFDTIEDAQSFAQENAHCLSPQALEFWSQIYDASKRHIVSVGHRVDSDDGMPSLQIVGTFRWTDTDHVADEVTTLDKERTDDTAG